MIEDQVQEVLDLLNSQLHGHVDYALFSKVFDAVADIGVPEGYKIVPVKPTKEHIQNLESDRMRFIGIDLGDSSEEHF